MNGITDLLTCLDIVLPAAQWRQFGAHVTFAAVGAHHTSTLGASAS